LPFTVYVYVWLFSGALSVVSRDGLSAFSLPVFPLLPELPVFPLLPALLPAPFTLLPPFTLSVLPVGLIRGVTLRVAVLRAVGYGGAVAVRLGRTAVCG
jgi:hypothetical protein